VSSIASLETFMERGTIFYFNCKGLSKILYSVSPYVLKLDGDLFGEAVG
jgi:hypothetical protein